MRQQNDSRERWSPGRILSCLALICYLLGPLHPLAAGATAAANAATNAAATETTVICTAHGLKTVSLTAIGLPGGTAPSGMLPTGMQDCPACLACPMPGCAGVAPALLGSSAAPLARSPLTVVPGLAIAFAAHAGRSLQQRPPRGPPIPA